MSENLNIKKTRRRMKVRKGTPAGLLLRTGALETMDPLTVGGGWHQLSDFYTGLAHARGLDSDVTVVCMPEAGAGQYGMFTASVKRIGLEGKILPVVPDVLDTSNGEHMQALAALHGVFEAQAAHVRFGIPSTAYMGLDTAQAFKVLEQIRVEARAISEQPDARQWLRAAANYLTAPTLTGPYFHNGIEVASAATLIEGRVVAGVLDAADAAPFSGLFASAMDDDLRHDLAGLWDRALAVADGDYNGMWDVAAQMSELFYSTDVQYNEFGPQLDDLLAQLAAEQLTAAAESLENMPGAWMEVLAAAQEASLGIDEEEYESLDRGLNFNAGGASQCGYARWSVRDPRDDEKAAMVMLAEKLKLARMRDRDREQYDTDQPGGRVRMSEAIREAADRWMGRMGEYRPYRRQRPVHNELPMLKLGVMVDLSGSMSGHMNGVSSSMWIMFNAAQEVHGDVMAVAFGDTAEILVEPRKAMPKVMNMRAVGGTDHIGLAAQTCADELDMTEGPRILAVVTDGAWAASAAHNDKIDQLRADGVKIVVINIGHPGVEQSCDYNIVVNDATEVATVLGEVCEQMLAEPLD